MVEFNNNAAVEWLDALAAQYHDKKNELTELDRQIGDGDHGINMARGFAAVKEKIASVADKDLGTILKTTAMTLISTVGGASGPLYGSFFLQGSMAVNGKTSIKTAELAMMFDAGLKSIINRGKAAIGEKTMIDAWQPAVDALKAHENESLDKAVEAAAEAARKGAESTIPMIATKGRASYLGERSVGHLDPGAASTTILFEELLKVVKQ